MKNTFSFMLAGIFFFSSFALIAGDDKEVMVEEKIVIALSTDEFELEETDLSDLAIGEAETIVTESGKTIDLLRTEDGVEVYVDGELLDAPQHGKHVIVKSDVEIICESDDEEECDELVWISEDGDVELEALHGGDHKVIMIHEEGDHENMDVDVEVLHEGHATAHKVIKIKHGEPGDMEGLHEAHGEKVIIIKKTVEDEI